MSSVITEGISVAIAGLIITFFSLGLFAVLIYVLGIIFKEKEEAPKAAIVSEETPTADNAETDDPNIPVVIATAIQYFHSKTHLNLGSELEAGRSNWWMVNRMRSQQGLGQRISRSGK